MNCIVCHRTMKNHSDTGAGPVCSRKLRGSEVSTRPIRVVCIFSGFDDDGFKMDRYLVFTELRQVVVIETRQTGRRASCQSMVCEGQCQHIDAVLAYLGVK